jgi:hypothetical protein
LESLHAQYYSANQLALKLRQAFFSGDSVEIAKA